MHTHDQAEMLLRMLAPRRNHFFYGKRMDVQHFQMEQNYGKHKQWLLNRLTLGKGVLCGLKVSSDGERLCVDPGVAIDGLGREIIVPERACIDPKDQDKSCCGGGPSTTYPPPPETTGTSTDVSGSGAHALDNTTGNASGHDTTVNRYGQLFTLWLCYNECLTDQQPVLVTDCETRQHCSPGTVVESFCLKVTAGIPALQGDPDWCLDWAQGAEAEAPSPNPDGTPNAEPKPAQPVAQLESLYQSNAATKDVLASLGLKPEEIIAALKSRRHALCSLQDMSCTPPEGDPCVPLAIGLLRDQRIAALEACLVRPRVYSNAVLLDLILCLAARVDQCCEPQTPPQPKTLLRVESVAFLSIDQNGNETQVATVGSPLEDVKIKVTLGANAIRVRFTDNFAQDAHVPNTHNHADPDFKRHNVMVLPKKPISGLDYVPGTLSIEDGRTIRFDLFPDSPYVRSVRGGGPGWQTGTYQLLLFGDDDAGAQRKGIANIAGSPLDGESAAPANGAISGDGVAGGTFKLNFIIG